MSAQERWTLAATVLGSGMAFLDGTVVNVAVTALQRDLGADAAGVQWVVNAYLLLLSALILTGGALGDRFGRRRVYALGVLVFGVASLACGLAPSLPWLLVARAVQGVGGALLVPGSLAMIGAVFPDARRGRAVGLWSAASSIVTLLGPLVGGVLVDHASWRWVFFVNVPLALLVLVCLPRVPETRGDVAPPDVLGSVLATVGLGGLAWGLTKAGEGGWSAATLGLALAGVLALALFVLWERRTPHPMLPLALFRSRAFSGTNALTLLLYGALGGVGFFLPLVLIGARGFSATAAGAALLPLSILMACLSGTFGALADKHGPRRFLTVGPILAGVGFALLGLPGTSFWVSVLPGSLVLGLGMALTVAPLSTAVLASVDRRFTGVASGVNNAVARAAGLLAVAALGGVLLGSYRGALDAQLSAAQVPAAARSAMVAQADQLAQVQPPTALPTAKRQAARRAVRAAFNDAFRVVALACGLLAVLSGLIGWFSLTSGPTAKRGAQPAPPPEHRP